MRVTYKFYIAKEVWMLEIVSKNDVELLDQAGEKTLAVTDCRKRKIYLSEELLYAPGESLKKVLIHELCHCVLYTYGMTDYLRKVVKKKYWVEAEENLANLMVNHARFIISAAESLEERILL